VLKFERVEDRRKKIITIWENLQPYWR